jgi:hypothetical protein
MLTGDQNIIDIAYRSVGISAIPSSIPELAEPDDTIRQCRKRHAADCLPSQLAGCDGVARGDIEGKSGRVQQTLDSYRSGVLIGCRDQAG